MEKKFKLISMTDFVLLEDGTFGYYPKIVRYAKFLKQPLKLEMFVPCNENGNVLGEPDEYQDFLKIGQQGIMLWGYNIYNHCKNYQQAKEKVLFEGFPDDILDLIGDESTVEDLLDDKYNTYFLTPTAIKQIVL